MKMILRFPIFFTVVYFLYFALGGIDEAQEGMPLLSPSTSLKDITSSAHIRPAKYHSSIFPMHNTDAPSIEPDDYDMRTLKTEARLKLYNKLNDRFYLNSSTKSSSARESILIGAIGSELVSTNQSHTAMCLGNYCRIEISNIQKSEFEFIEEQIDSFYNGEMTNTLEEDYSSRMIRLNDRLIYILEFKLGES